MGVRYSLLLRGIITEKRVTRMNILLSVSVALLAGLLMTRAFKPFKLPAVTAYLLAGVLIGPYCIGALRIEGLGFSSMEEVEILSLVSQVALGFIAFSIGNEFRVEDLKKIGKQAFAGSGLRELRIPEGVEKIGPQAFAYCRGLVDIYIPASVKTIGQEIFSVGTKGIYVHTPAGSYAETYLKTYVGVNVVNDEMQ